MEEGRITARLRVRAIPYVDPLGLYAQLRAERGVEDVFLLESLAGPEQDSREALVGVARILSVSVRGTRVTLSGLSALYNRLASYPGAEWTFDGQAEFVLRTRASLWPLLRAIQDCFAVQGPADLSGLRFGFFGCFGYDIIHAIENLPTRIAAQADEVPDLCLAVFSTIVRFDLIRREALLVQASSSHWADTGLPAQHVPDGAGEIPEVAAPAAIHYSVAKSAYLAGVQRALEYIAAGDIYQVQIGHAIQIESVAPPLDVYRRLRARNPAPYMYLAGFSSVELIGSSPEVLFRTTGSKVIMRPIAGTIRTGANAEEDARQSAKLRRDPSTSAQPRPRGGGEPNARPRVDPKEIAEHIMLVDLCRNDLGRVCEAGSVSVTDLMNAERYSHVLHLVSTVAGQVAPPSDCYAMIRATFPAGTMTGAPKIRAVEIIEELESTRRGCYAGAVGYLDFSGDSCLALCIRTAAYRTGRYTIRASAGVVADSRPEQEWAETIAKLGAPYWAICGTELMP